MAEVKMVFFLTSGQKPPTGSTSIALSGGGIIWEGEEETFPETVTFGKINQNEPTPSNTYSKRLATAKEIQEYQNILDGVYDIGE